MLSEVVTVTSLILQGHKQWSLQSVFTDNCEYSHINNNGDLTGTIIASTTLNKLTAGGITVSIHWQSY